MLVKFIYDCELIWSQWMSCIPRVDEWIWLEGEMYVVSDVYYIISDSPEVELQLEFVE